MSDTNAKLTPNMMAALILVRDYRTLTGIRSITRTALLRRGLIDIDSHGVTQGVAWNVRLTEAGVALVGRKDTADLEATLAADEVEQADPAPVRITAAQKLTRLQAEASWHEACCSLRAQGIDCGCAEAAADRVTGFEAEDFTTCEHDRYPDDCDACAAPTPDPVGPRAQVADRSAGNRLVFDNTLIGLVLGTSIDPVTGAANGVDVLIDGDVQSIPHMVLDLCDVKAVCAHGYGSNDSCPGCDADDDEIRDAVNANIAPVRRYLGGGITIDLGTLVWHTEDNSYSALLATGTIVARHVSHVSAERALELDHKVRCMLGAYNENVLRDITYLEQARDRLTNRQNAQQIDDTVRLLHSLGVTTAEEFLARLEAIDLEVGGEVRHIELKDAAVRRPVRLDEMIVVPAGLWSGTKTDRLPSALPEIRMTAAEAFEVIDFSGPMPFNLHHTAVLGSLEHTHPVVTDVNDESAL